MFRRLVLLIFALCLAYPAWSAEPDKKDAKPDPANYLKLPFLVAPMTQDGNLLGYAYISSRMTCSSPSACVVVGNKIPFLQDAFVRDVNAKPVALASDPKEVDKDLLNARLTAVAKRIVGGDKVVGMTFLEIKFMALHPSDSASEVPPPEQAPAGNAQKTGAATVSTAPEGAKNASSAGATSKPATGHAP